MSLTEAIIWAACFSLLCLAVIRYVYTDWKMRMRVREAMVTQVKQMKERSKEFLRSGVALMQEGDANGIVDLIEELVSLNQNFPDEEITLAHNRMVQATMGVLLYFAFRTHIRYPLDLEDAPSDIRPTPGCEEHPGPGPAAVPDNSRPGSGDIQ